MGKSEGEREKAVMKSYQEETWVVEKQCTYLKWRKYMFS